jgi:hypothetical protein
VRERESERQRERVGRRKREKRLLMVFIDKFSLTEVVKNRDILTVVKHTERDKDTHRKRHPH